MMKNRPHLNKSTVSSAVDISFNLDMAVLSQATKRFQEASQPLLDVHKRYQDAMQPFFAKVEKARVNHERFVQAWKKKFSISIPKIAFKLSDEWSREIEWIMQRYRAAVADPENEKSKPWLELKHMALSQVRAIVKCLPDPRVKRGRPKGSGHVVSDKQLISEVGKLVETGLRPTTAARKVLIERGVRVGLKNRADYIAKQYKTSMMREKK